MVFKDVDAFLRSLLALDKDNIPLPCLQKCEKDYFSNPNFNPNYIRSKSRAAASLCVWVVNICKFFRLYQVSFPLLCSYASSSTRDCSLTLQLTLSS